MVFEFVLIFIVADFAQQKLSFCLMLVLVEPWLAERLYVLLMNIILNCYKKIKFIVLFCIVAAFYDAATFIGCSCCQMRNDTVLNQNWNGRLLNTVGVLQRRGAHSGAAG